MFSGAPERNCSGLTPGVRLLGGIALDLHRTWSNSTEYIGSGFTLGGTETRNPALRSYKYLGATVLLFDFPGVNLGVTSVEWL